MKLFVETWVSLLIYSIKMQISHMSDDAINMIGISPHSKEQVEGKSCAKEWAYLSPGVRNE